MHPIGSTWPLHIPSDEDVKKWDDLPKLARSCLEDDFYVYSMGCLSQWEHAVPKNEMGKWILHCVADGFAYEGSGCENYDKYMLGTYGGGRGKKTWAERIGKNTNGSRFISWHPVFMTTSIESETIGNLSCKEPL